MWNIKAGTVRCHLERRAEPEAETRRATAGGRISDGKRDAAERLMIYNLYEVGDIQHLRVDDIQLKELMIYKAFALMIYTAVP